MTAKWRLDIMTSYFYEKLIWKFQAQLFYEKLFRSSVRRNSTFLVLLETVGCDVYMFKVHTFMTELQHWYCGMRSYMSPGPVEPALGSYVSRPVHQSLCLSLTKVLILPVITFFWFFCNKLACSMCRKVTKPDFWKKILKSFLEAIYVKKWGFGWILAIFSGTLHLFCLK